MSFDQRKPSTREPHEEAAPGTPRTAWERAILAAGAMPPSPPRVLRASHAFRLLLVEGGVRVEAVEPSEAARRALARLYAVHSRAPHPVIARAVAFDSRRGVVELDCPAVTDLEAVVRRAGQKTLRASHSEADGLIVELRDALRAAARVTTPDGRPGCVGTLGYGNVLFTSTGHFFLIGLGHNVAYCDEAGAPIGDSPVFQAPEVAVGAPASEKGDFVALLKMTRALIPFVRLEPAIARCLAGNSLGEDAELVRRILWIERNVISAEPSVRASIAKTIRVSDRIRTLLGVWPDPDAFRARIRETLGSAAEPTAPIRIHRRGAYFERAGLGRVDLTRRRVMARLLEALVLARSVAPDAVLDVATLREAGWPGERMGVRVGANRVYVAINGLRKLGLGPELERAGRGYRLRPGTPIEIVEGDAAL
ncbi:MAG: hypothetical protein KF729_00190 [Sandaracinaceae bacterium]|nr:hypothetical protein [Sandaracinaceae bacterium]